MTSQILSNNSSRSSPSCRETLEPREGRGVYTASVSEGIRTPNLKWTRPPVSAVKRRKCRAPNRWQSTGGLVGAIVAGLLGFSLPVLAQPLALPSADEFFHAGAQSYITNNLAGAREQVDAGLKLFPDDIKLKKLDDLLKQQQQQQQQDRQKQDQEKKEQEKKEQQKQDQKDQQDKKDEKKDQKDQQKQEQQQQSKSGGEKDKKDGEKKDAQPMQAHAMTPQEAKQLLDAQKGDEQVLVFRPEEKPERRNRILK